MNAEPDRLLGRLYAGRWACIFLSALVCASGASARQRVRPALGEGDARRAIASAPGFALETGAVKVLAVSPRGQTPVRVTAEVTLAVRLMSASDGGGAQTAGPFERRRWRAVEFRVGDREWEDFDLLAEAAGEDRVESVRDAIEDLATEFESLKGDGGGVGGGDTRATEPLTRGPLRVNKISALGPSAVAEVAFEAEFILARGPRGRWQVGEMVVGGVSSGDLNFVRLGLDTRKGVRARAELEMVASAHERYRRQRGLYVSADDFSALMDHLSPLYISEVIRVDPWHRPYRYAGASGGYLLSSAGPDGRPDTADDIRVSSKQ